VTGELRLRELLERLAQAEVRFLLVGGLAVNAWGHVRGTQDVDIVPDPDGENLGRLARVLEGADGRVETAEGRLAGSAIRTFLAGLIGSRAQARSRAGRRSHESASEGWHNSPIAGTLPDRRSLTCRPS